MQVIRFFNKENYGNSYAVVEGSEFILIDCTQTPDYVLGKLGNLFKKDMVCKAVFITHGHYDHFSNINDWCGLGIKIYATEQCYEKIANAELNCSNSFGVKVEYVVPDSLRNIVVDKQKLRIMDKDITIYSLPGHTDCSVAIEFEGNLFVGDVIFAGKGYGRCDLPTGNVEQMIQSLQKINSMDDELNINPGHGLGFKLGDSKPFVI